MRYNKNQVIAMKLEALMDYLKLGTISFPRMLLYHYRELKLTEEEFLFLIYFLGFSNKVEFDPKKIGKDLQLQDTKVFELLTSLKEKGFLEVKLEKNDKGILQENVLLDGYYDKMGVFLLEQKNITEEVGENLFEAFEREFGRTLSPMEYEIINAWLEDHFVEDIILEALKEAVYNGVCNLRYIDRIIYEWRKKGLTSIKEIRDYTEKFRKEKIASKEKVELFDYNWLDGGSDEG